MEETLRMLEEVILLPRKHGPKVSLVVQEVALQMVYRA
jgi:hypothetical protein